MDRFHQTELVDLVSQFEGAEADNSPGFVGDEGSYEFGPADIVPPSVGYPNPQTPGDFLEEFISKALDGPNAHDLINGDLNLSLCEDTLGLLTSNFRSVAPDEIQPRGIPPVEMIVAPSMVRYEMSGPIGSFGANIPVESSVREGPYFCQILFELSKLRN